MKYLLAFILLFSLVLPLSGCTSPDTVDEENGKSFIWKISSDNSHVYLLGSVHIATPDIYPLDSVIEEAFQESEKLVVEININEVSIFGTMMLLDKYGAYPEGEGLRENLPESLYHKLESTFSEMDIPISTLDSYRPWVIVMMMEGMVITDQDYSADYGIDLHFMDGAVDRDMEILELETVEYQLEIMSGLPDELMIQVIEMYVEGPDMDDYINIVGYMLALWEKGDAEGLEEVLFEDLEEEPALAPYYDVIFDQRNYNMITKIEEYLADEYTYFIIVGAGHLVGEEGLLNLLDEAGYTIEQL
jgi:uncharacterized protein YbaP (TraB family)